MATEEITSNKTTTTISIVDNDDVTDDVTSSSDAFRKDCICDVRSGTGDVVISSWKASTLLRMFPFSKLFVAIFPGRVNMTGL